MARKSQKSMDQDVLSRLQRRVSDWFNYYSENNRVYRKVTEFVYQEDAQWSDAEISEYKQDGRPRLTFNMLPRYITSLAAEFAENVPDLEVSSEHFEEIEQEKIDLMTNLLRNISFDSRNDIVYSTAAQCAWTGGYGAFRLIVERENPRSFNFVVRYKSIADPTTCFFDPIARLTDKSDGNYCGISYAMSKEEFETKYPGIPAPTSVYGLDYSSDFQWVTEDQVTIVDYWEKIPVNISVALLSDGSVVDGNDAEATVRKMNKLIKELKELQPGPSIKTQPITIEKTETHQDVKIKFYRAIKDKILEEAEWDGKRLPIIFVGGITKWVKGKERTFGLIHWMRDAQRSYNYARSEYLYRLQLTRYEKFMVTKENVADNQEMWKNPHKAKSALIYKRGINGEVPINIPPQSIGNDLQAEMSRSLSDLQQIPGRFDSNLGASSNEIAGVAIANRQRAGNLNVKEFFDNASAAIESGAKVSLDLIPKVYDSQRRVSLTKQDGSSAMAQINDKKENEISSTIFNVTVKTGSSFAIQQSENVERLIRLAQINPKLADLVSDLIVENIDLKNGPQMVERIHRWAIPRVAATEGSKDKIVIANAQQEMQNPEAALHAKEDQLRLMEQELNIKAKEQQLILSQLTAQDQKRLSMAAQNTGLASLQNAQTKREDVEGKYLMAGQTNERENNKAEAEEVRAQASIEKEVIESMSNMALEHNKAQNEHRENLINIMEQRRNEPEED
jgi:hypothetical protein